MSGQDEPIKSSEDRCSGYRRVVEVVIIVVYEMWVVGQQCDAQRRTRDIPGMGYGVDRAAKGRNGEGSTGSQGECFEG